MHNKALNVSARWLIKVFILLMLVNEMVMSAAYAAANVSMETMVKNISETIPQLMTLTTALAYVMGFFFVYNGLRQLKKMGEERTQMSSESSLKTPLVSLAVGASLIYLPSAVQSGLTSFWLEPNPYGYETATSDEWSELLSACFMIVQLVGVIAFIRGLVTLTHLGNQQATLGKALAYIVGGVLCIDIYDFLTAVLNTLGLSLTP